MINFLKKYFHHIFYPIAWTIIVLILLTLPGSMLPQEKAFAIPNFDKLVHMSLFGGFVLLWSLYFNKKIINHRKLLIIFFRIFIIASLYGATTEFIQKYIPSRDFDIADILADVAGAAIAYGIANIFLSRFE
ncbi:MAG TPA: VanZ family protein [Puia sp.]|jgi:VanZ family protein|nr:VanZ family protein [Puia sp.]